MLSFAGQYNASANVTEAFSSPNVSLGFFSTYSIHHFCPSGRKKVAKSWSPLVVIK
jgi:hypothetical protein